MLLYGWLTTTAPLNPRYAEVGPSRDICFVSSCKDLHAQLIPLRNIYLEGRVFAYEDDTVGADESTCVVFPRGR